MRQAYYKRESSFLLEGRPKTMLFIHSGSYSGTGKWGKANLLITTKEDFITMQSRCEVNGPLEVVNGAPGPLQIEAALRGEIQPETFVITRHIPVGTDPNTMYLYVSHYTNSQVQLTSVCVTRSDGVKTTNILLGLFLSHLFKVTGLNNE